MLALRVALGSFICEMNGRKHEIFLVCLLPHEHIPTGNLSVLVFEIH